jgi:hypothetical protein
MLFSVTKICQKANYSLISLYTFDVLPIFIVCVLYNIWFPGDYLKHLGFRVPKSERHRALDAESIASQQELTTHVHWRDESK